MQTSTAKRFFTMALFAFAPTAGLGQAPEKTRVVYDLRKDLMRMPDLSLYGPGADEAAQTDPQGLRMKLAASRKDGGHVGIEVASRIRGDFDISVGYEILLMGTPVGEFGAGVGFRVFFVAPDGSVALMSRTKRPAGEQFGILKIAKNAEGKDQYLPGGHESRAAFPKGRMRMVRQGTRLQFWASENDAPYAALKEWDFGADDVEKIRVYLTSNGKNNDLDVRLSDISIDTDRASDIAAANRPEQVAGEAAKEVNLPSSGTLPRLLVAALVLLAALLAGAGIFLVRRHRQTPPPEPAAAKDSPPPAFLTASCSGCGKNLKVKAALAGKKVKCPKCGQPTLVAASDD